MNAPQTAACASMPDFTLIAPKIGRLLRLLTSGFDGEILAAARAIRRTLEKEKFDIHTVAEIIETANGARKFSEADGLEIYRRAFQEGRDAAEAERGFRSVDHEDPPTWHDIALECEAHQEQLRDGRERKFIADMIVWTVHGGTPTEKQAAWLRKIYARIRRCS